MPERAWGAALLGLVLLGGLVWAQAQRWPDPTRFAQAIAGFAQEDARQRPPEGAIVCLGSSSMRGWHRDIAQDLAPLTVIKRGFGGSNANDVLHYLDELVLQYRPRAVVLYEGDNDVAAGLDPQTIRDVYAQIIQRVLQQQRNTRCYVLAVKPSPSRWALWPTMQETNQLLRALCRKSKQLHFVDIASPMLGEDGQPKPEIFKSDRLHMNRAGYELWTEALRPLLLKHEAGQGCDAE